VLTQFLAFDIRERVRDTLIGIVHAAVERLAILGAQPVLLIPDVQGGFLEGNGIHVSGYEFHH
jgi:hypothetical protein